MKMQNLQKRAPQKATAQPKSPSTSDYKLLLLGVLFLAATCVIHAQSDSLNASKLGKITNNLDLNDVWGYAANGQEYALYGSNDGFNVVNVTNPTAPTAVFSVYGAYSLWRDIKTWGHYAYCVHDSPFAWNTVPREGLLIVDLDSMTTPRYKRFRPSFSPTDSLTRAHNLWIDENGVLYIFGSNIMAGGALMYDVATDPWNPTYLGMYNATYLHDGYAINDTLYGAAVNNGFFNVIDVTNKANPVVVNTHNTPSLVSHNTWRSDDGKTLFTTDEITGGYIASYDISDPNNITELDRFRTLSGTGVIPHNAHVFGNFLVTSYYTRGLQILDVKYPDLMVEVSYYDTSPLFTGTGYHGAWGAYPFLPSGNILVSDIEEGLFVLHSEYPEASRVYGIVKDSLSGSVLFGATVQLSENTFTASTNLYGAFKAGFVNAGWDTAQVNLAGYYPAKMPLEFIAGQYDTVVIALLPLNFSVDEIAETKLEIYPNPSSDVFEINVEHLQTKNLALQIFDVSGKLVFHKTTEFQATTKIAHGLQPGIYIVKLRADDEVFTQKIVVQ